MSDSWVNWGDFLGANSQQQAADADRMEQLEQQQRGVMEKALASIGESGNDVARDGRFGGLDKLNGYSQLMASRDAALQANAPAQQAAPWESDMGGRKFVSPWEELNKRLGGMNNQLAQRNTQALNQQAADKAKAERDAFLKAQKDKLDAAINGKPRTEAEAYAQWSDAVRNAGNSNGGAGAAAYYDAAKGTGPKPVTQGWGPRTMGMVGRLYRNQQNQLMPPTTDSNFGQSTSGF